MSSSIDRVMCLLNLEDEDKPFDLPDLPEYCSSEKNTQSLIGRLLNPDYQKVSDIIFDLPRMWQIKDRVRGVALTKEKFQFIFKYEHDMEEILSKGVHTYNQWGVVIDRWVERPPANYLQQIPVWVQIRNIPVNHYTKEAITVFGEFAGKVTEVAFDPLKPQNKEYVRVRVDFYVSNPIRRSKVVNLPSGETVSILYDYERFQKRCFACQRLTHDQEKCPLVLRKGKSLGRKEKNMRSNQKNSREQYIKESDPLFGVLSEDQVGLNPMTGRPRIAAEVLEGMRIYLSVSSVEERLARVERVKKSLADLEFDPIGQKTMLRLEPAPLLTSDIDKGKGLVFDFEVQSKQKKVVEKVDQEQKMMASAIRSGLANSRLPLDSVPLSDPGMEASLVGSNNFLSCPTAFRIGLSEASSSGSLTKKGKPRKRPYKSRRVLKGKDVGTAAMVGPKKVGALIGELSKRKAELEGEGRIFKATCSNSRIVPNEGLSKIQ